MDIEFVKCALSYKNNFWSFILQMKKEKHHNKIEQNNTTYKKA